MTKNSAADRLRLQLAEAFSGAAAPTTGVAATIGSLYLQNTGTAGSGWLKTGAGDTQWTQLQQSFNWFVVTNFGATGDGATDDRAAIQAAIAACVAAGGGVVYFPQGTYACSKDGANPYSFDLNGSTDIQFHGSGFGSVIKQLGSAATNPWSLFRIRGGAARIRFQNLGLDGSGLTNPSASADSHLINVVGTATAIQCFSVRFNTTITGDGLHCVGTAGNLVTVVMATDCEFLSCSRYGVLYGEGVQYAWIEGCYAKGCLTEYAVISAANVTQDSIILLGNIAEHTAAGERRAIIVTGNATARATKITCAQNIVITGFSQFDNIQYGVITGNVQTSGAYASATAVMALTGLVDVTVSTNLLDRAGASAGPLISLDASAVTPVNVRIGNNTLINEVVGTAGNPHFILVKNSTVLSVGGNICRATDVGVSVTYGIELHGTTIACDTILMHGNLLTSAAGSLIAGIRWLVNGASIGNVNCNGNTMAQVDYGLATEDAGAGTFNGTIYMWAGNSVVAATGDILQTGSTITFAVGWNAGAFGPTLKKGTGSPEGVQTARIGSWWLREDGPPSYKETGNGTNTGWIAIGGGMVTFGIADAGTAATALFMAPAFASGVAGATELQIPVTRPGTIRNLRVHITGVGTDNQLVTFTVRKNGVDTTIVATKANDSNGDTSDTTHSTTVVAGDLISIKITKGGVVTAGQSNVLASLELA